MVGARVFAAPGAWPLRIGAAMTTDTLRPDSDSGQEIITRAEAKARGLKHYFTGKVCKNGHCDRRHVSTGKCMRCSVMWALKTYYLDVDKSRDKNRIKAKKASQYYIEYRIRNKDQIAARIKKWHSENIDRRRAHVRNRRARLLNVGGSHTTADIERIYREQRGCCAWCRKKVKFGERHVDHIVPVHKGGSNDPANLAISCKTCNHRKSAKDPLDFARELGRLL